LPFVSAQEQVASPHHVRIHLDAPQATHAIGQAITGHVTMTGVASDAGELRVEIHAYGTGHSGQRSLNVVASQSLYAGAVAPSHTQTFPFHLTVPRMVSGYRGNLFTIDTRLAAVTLLASQGSTKEGARRVPAAWVPIAIAADTRPMSIAPQEALMTHDVREGPGGLVVGCLLAVGTVLGGVAFALSGSWPQIADMVSLWSLMTGFLSVTFVAAGISGVVRTLKDRAIYKRVGATQLRVSPRLDGNGVDVEVWGDRLLGVDGGCAELHVEERARTFVGYAHSAGSTVTRTDTTTQPLAHHVVVLVSRPHEHRLVGMLPLLTIGHLPPAINDGWATIGWRLELRVPLPGAPDLTWTMPLEAGPGGEPFPQPPIATNG
jgi:hypothetical protein